MPRYNTAAKRAEHAARLRAYRATKKGKISVRNINLKAAHGISLSEYDALLASQDGLCAVCRKPETEVVNQFGGKVLSVDHDHKTDRIRGLLCMKCNRALGLLEDDSKRILMLSQYVENRPTAYLSGPMRGKKDLNKGAFRSAAAKLRRLGWNVLDPSSFGDDKLDQSSPSSWRIYAQRDIGVIVKILQAENGDAIIMLPGWKKSLGARAENAVARWVGLRRLTLKEALK